MSMEKYDLAFNYGRFGVVGILHCWSTQYPHLSSREVAEKTLDIVLSGIWGILDDEGKEVLMNAFNSR